MGWQWKNGGWIWEEEARGLPCELWELHRSHFQPHWFERLRSLSVQAVSLWAAPMTMTPIRGWELGANRKTLKPDLLNLLLRREKDRDGPNIKTKLDQKDREISDLKAPTFHSQCSRFQSTDHSFWTGAATQGYHGTRRCKLAEHKAQSTSTAPRVLIPWRANQWETFHARRQRRLMMRQWAWMIDHS